jgi:DNA-binding GntR family transcriptional regulator
VGGELAAHTLVDALCAALRERILTGALPGGAPLTEHEVATRYEVARPTAKAAIERLVHEGLLRRSANKTARVPLLSAADVRDLYFSRSVIESGVVAALARQRRVPAAAGRAVAELRAGDAEAELAFHVALVEALDSPRTSRMYASMVGETRLCMAQVPSRTPDPASAADEHAGVLEAIEAGDEVRAVARLAAHLERGT